jgi:hypothetical protein
MRNGVIFPQEVSAWMTSDRVTFSDKGAAERHEAALALKARRERIATVLQRNSDAELVRFLDRHYPMGRLIVEALLKTDFMADPETPQS